MPFGLSSGQLLAATPQSSLRHRNASAQIASPRRWRVCPSTDIRPKDLGHPLAHVTGRGMAGLTVYPRPERRRLISYAAWSST
jgi:hypothetical protein